jgi:hypothetical protein
MELQRTQEATGHQRGCRQEACRSTRCKNRAAFAADDTADFVCGAQTPAFREIWTANTRYGARKSPKRQPVARALYAQVGHWAQRWTPDLLGTTACLIESYVKVTGRGKIVSARTPDT